jgi:hypothetical protein
MRKLIEELGWIALGIFIAVILILGSTDSLKSASSNAMQENLSYQKNYP